jgi:signal transduction histidine kinase
MAIMDATSGVPERAEERMARAMAYVRCAMVLLQFVPLLYLARLRLPWLAVTAAVASGAEAAWLMRRVRTIHTLRDPVLIWTDVAFCLCLIGAGYAAAGPAELNHVMTEVLPFALAGAGFAGFGLGWSWNGVAATAVLSAAWAIAAIPSDDPKVISDLLGFVLWYIVAMLVARDFRDMAQLAEIARQAAANSQEEIAERIRDADVARERELTYQEIHDHLLPIVDAVAAGTGASDRLVTLAIREAARARRLIVDGRVKPGQGFAALLTDIRDTYIDAGLALTTVLRIVADPPDDIAETVAHAAREALSNVLKHAGGECEVNLYAESTEAWVEAVVRDHGTGFAPGTVLPGGGFSRTFEAVRRRGGTVEVRSSPESGTKVSIRWPAGDGPA